ncbi:shikimate kinase [Bacteroidales bacterium OttesenSCG-928-A17]|nr:shikimate kinase [Bacteroidales bacterium OttesenSCG-928-A17]
MPQLFLIGYMGSGKTTLGKCLAKKLGLSFIDIDLFIGNRFRKSIDQIFREYGEEKFREMEHAILREIVGFEDTVISTGGGTPCFFNNMGLMKEYGTTIYLKVDSEELTKRLKNGKNNRPLLKDKSNTELQEFIEENIKKRETYYNEADFIVPAEKLFTKKDIDTGVDELICHLKKQALL